MKIYRSIEEFSSGQKVCLAIGFFDGVHLGHQQIIRQTIGDAHRHGAASIVLTFDEHPASIVAPARVPPLIYSLPQKLRTIGTFAPDAILLVHFDRAFSEQPGEGFVRSLAARFRIQSLCVGANFKFGYNRSGDVALLKRLGAELNFTVHGISAVSLDDKPVSSTRIRERIQSGDLDAASQMLGREYSLSSTVIHGDELGHKLGFPTANLEINGLCTPPNGVYATQARACAPHSRAMEISATDAVCQPHSSVTNIGVRPTLNQAAPQKRLEVHLLDFTDDLYDREVEITFLEKIRDEQKFSNLEALKVQIALDTHRAREILSSSSAL